MRVFGGTKSHSGRGASYYGGFWKVDHGRAWVVEEPYDVAPEDVGGLLDFTKSHQEPSKLWNQMEAPIGRGADRKRAR